MYFLYRYKLEEHVSQHHNKHLEINRNNVCHICDQGFTRPENLKKHKIRPHVFHCEHCVKSFIAVDRLERHVLSEHRPGGEGARGEKVLCELCGKNFRQLHILRKHKEIDHKNPCGLCDKRFTMRHWLREHMKIAHSAEECKEPFIHIKESKQGVRKMLPDLIKIEQEEDQEEEEEVPSPWQDHEDQDDQEKEVPSPWESRDIYDEDEETGFSDSSSIFSLLSQELLEPQVEIEEYQDGQEVMVF